MKNKQLLPTLLILLLGCQSQDSVKEKESTATTVPSTSAAQTDTIPKNDEYLDWQSVRINNKLPLITSVKNVTELLGKSDSVNTIDWNETCSSDFRSQDSRLAYYSGFQFEQFGDSLDFQTLDFTKNRNLFLQCGELKLNSSTTLDEIRTYFPKAVKSLEKMKAYGIEGEVDVIGIPPSRELTDGQWYLMFQNGKLVRIEDWFPC